MGFYLFKVADLLTVILVLNGERTMFTVVSMIRIIVSMVLVALAGMIMMFIVVFIMMRLVAAQIMADISMFQ